MHAFLIVATNSSTTQKEVLNIAEKNKATVLPFVLQKIEDVRQLKKMVSLLFSKKTAIFLEDFGDATIDAQNAFLKNLEEPQPNLIYILHTSNLSGVLPTIQSRCQIIKTVDIDRQIPQEHKDFLNANLDSKMEYIAKLKDRLEAIKFVEDLIYLDRQMNKFANMQSYINAIKSLKLNGNVSLQLLNLVVTMNSHGR